MMNKDKRKFLINSDIRSIKDKYVKANHLISHVNFSLTEAAKVIGVKPRKLQVRIKSGINVASKGSSGRPGWFSNNDINDFFKFIKDGAEIHHCPTFQESLTWCVLRAEKKQDEWKEGDYNLPKKLPDSSCLDHFISRHKDKIKKIKIVETDRCRETEVSKVEVYNYFKTLEKILPVKPELIFNIDEHMFKDPKSKQSVECIVVVDEKDPIRYGDSEHARIQLGFMCIISNLPKSFPPAILLQQGQNLVLNDEQKTYVDNKSHIIEVKKPSSLSQSSFKQLITDWLIPTVEKARLELGYTVDDVAVVITDNHTSRCCVDSLIRLNHHNIYFVCLPAHTTHRYQPLDVAVFGPMSTYFRNKKWCHMEPSESHYTNKILKSLTAFSAATSDLNILSGFSKCGIYPLAVPTMKDIETKWPNNIEDRQGSIDTEHRKYRHTHFNTLTQPSTIHYYAKIHKEKQENIEQIIESLRLKNEY